MPQSVCPWVLPGDRKSLVYKGHGSSTMCCDQALRILPGGEWIVFFMTGGEVEPDRSNYVALCRSRDSGYTWGPLEVVCRPPGQACTLTEAWVQEETVTLFLSLHGGRFDHWTNHTLTSRDGGRTWGRLEAFQPLPRRSFPRNMYRTESGVWIAPFQYYPPYQGESASPFEDGSLERMEVGCLWSADEGLSWERSGVVPAVAWAENNVVETGNGSLAMLIRMDGTGFLWRSDSRDSGRSWSTPVMTAIPNPGSKFRLFRLSDGRILLLHNPNSATSHPNSKPHAQCHRNPLALWISDDGLSSWSYQRILTDFPGHLAYPDGVVDEEERFLHFAFDYNRHDVIYWGAQIPPR